MNREIKFRVYDKDLKRMRYLNSSHDFICFDEKGNGYYHNMQTGLGEWFSDLMQYTGLKDKNGVEVYENDIIGIHQTVNGYNQFVIQYDNYKFSARYYNQKTKQILGWYQYDLDKLFEINETEKEMELIGNVYENEVD